MNFELKDYKLTKIKNYFLKTKLFFFFTGINLKTINWIKIEQELNKAGLEYNKIHNNLTSNFIKKSIFTNILFLINGPIILIKKKKLKKSSITNIGKINPLLCLLCIRINNKIYSVNQTKKLLSLSYSKNVLMFQKNLKFILKLPFKKLKKSS